MKLGIVVSDFYWEEITSKMLHEALMVCKKKNVSAPTRTKPINTIITIGAKPFPLTP